MCFCSLLSTCFGHFHFSHFPVNRTNEKYILWRIMPTFRLPSAFLSIARLDRKTKKFFLSFFVNQFVEIDSERFWRCTPLFDTGRSSRYVELSGDIFAPIFLHQKVCILLHENFCFFLHQNFFIFYTKIFLFFTSKFLYVFIPIFLHHKFFLFFLHQILNFLNDFLGKNGVKSKKLV